MALPKFRNLLPGLPRRRTKLHAAAQLVHARINGEQYMVPRGTVQLGEPALLVPHVVR